MFSSALTIRQFCKPLERPTTSTTKSVQHFHTNNGVPQDGAALAKGFASCWRNNPKRKRNGMFSPIPIRGRTTATCVRTTRSCSIIDMQTDFCGSGGYVDKMGYDLSLTRAPIGPIQERARCRARARGITSCTRARDIAPISSDLPENKRWRSQRIGAGIGDPGPAARFSFAASRAGKSFRNWRRSPAKR